MDGMSDKGLGWAPRHDPRSLNYHVAEVLPTTVEERIRTWAPPRVVLDQGREGACVGFAWAAELAASPRPDPTITVRNGNHYAMTIYNRAKQIDFWPGEAYEGTSVLAGAKTVQERGYIESYRWATSIEDVRATVTEIGPVVIGIPWYSGMYSTRPSGLVNTTGTLVGGHALVVYGYHPGMRINGEGWHERHRVFRWRNSWGYTYGRNGSGLIRYEDLRDLLASNGEACVPMGRNMVRIG